MGGGWLLQWLLSVVAVYEQMSGRWLVVAGWGGRTTSS